MKAYMVTEEYESHAAIVFAKGGAEARRLGANELGIDWESVESCTRCPEYDKYAEAGDVPKEVLIADGWWFECGHCGIRIDSDMDDVPMDDGLDHCEFQTVIRGNEIYCSHKCLALHDKRQRNKKAAESALVEWVTTMYPEAKVTSVHVYGDKLEPTERNGRGALRAGVFFEVPGLSMPAQWIWPQDGILVMQNDVEAWNRYRNAAKAAGAVS